MAADPTLADRLDERAEPGHLPIIGYSFAADLRAAAVRLRKLDAIDPSDWFNGEELLLDFDAIYALLRRIADALGGTE